MQPLADAASCCAWQTLSRQPHPLQLSPACFEGQRSTVCCVHAELQWHSAMLRRQHRAVRVYHLRNLQNQCSSIVDPPPEMLSTPLRHHAGCHSSWLQLRPVMPRLHRLQVPGPHQHPFHIKKFKEVGHHLERHPEAMHHLQVQHLPLPAASTTAALASAPWPVLYKPQLSPCIW